jgi:ATP-dependent protease HslVU (ClpYQ) peptidase subunit
MTVIVWDGETLAADKQATENGVLHTITKIRKVAKGKYKGWLLGNAGSAASGQMMMDWFEVGADPRTFPYENQKTEGLCAYLIAISPQGVIHRYEHLPIPIIFEDEFYAIGSGKDMAIGALAMGADAATAVQVVCTYETDCGVGIDVLPLKEKQRARAGSKGKTDKAGDETGRIRKAAAPAKRAARPASKATQVAKQSRGGRV